MSSPVASDPVRVATGSEVSRAPTSHKAITRLPIHTGNVKAIRLATTNEINRAISKPEKKNKKN